MRQGKLSELIHNSGSPADTVVEEPVAAPADAEADEYAEEEDEDEDDYDQGGKKKKGKKGKGKKKATVQDEAGLIGSCTVEVWFREIIDLVRLTAFCVSCAL
jgi:structural maintenance of chromosome 4